MKKMDLKKCIKIILLLIFSIICFSLVACANNSAIQGIELDVSEVVSEIEPIDSINFEGLKVRIVYSDGLKSPLILGSDTRFSIQSSREGGEYLVTVKHIESEQSASYSVSIKEVSEIISVTLPKRRVYGTGESKFEIDETVVKLKYSDGTYSREFEIGEVAGFSARKAINNESLVLSYEGKYLSLPIVFLEGFNNESGIVSITRENFVTGPNSINADLLKERGFSQTDLGISLFDTENGLHYFFYGDTFPSLTPDGYGFSGTWHSNYYAVSSDLDFTDGIEFEDATGPVIEGNHQDNKPDLSGEVTKIPTGGIVIDGTPYMFYMSISDWNDWKIRWTGCVKLVGGEWVNVPGLNWVDSAAEQYIEGHPAYLDTGFDYVITSANRFKQILVCPNSEDQYLYLYATGNGRVTDARLMRVLPEKFEDISFYEYFCGIDEGESIWKNCAERGVIDSVVVIDKETTSRSIGELTVTYNPYLDKYMATYCADNFQSGYSNYYYGLLMRLSDTPYGPFDEIYLLDKKSKLNAPGGIYGAFTSEGLFEEGGRIVYLQVSSFTPTYNAQLYRIEFSKRLD